MPRILVPPEVLIRVSWEGTTRSRFFEDFQHAHGEMKTIEHLRIIGQELKGIAFRFISADMHEDLMIAARRVAHEPKTFWDHAGTSGRDCRPVRSPWQIR